MKLVTVFVSALLLFAEPFNLCGVEVPCTNKKNSKFYLIGHQSNKFSLILVSPSIQDNPIKWRKKIKRRKIIIWDNVLNSEDESIYPLN